MTQEEITKGNKIIAEFMGAKPSAVDNDKRDLRFTEPHARTETYAFYPWNLKYHTSWDWLMPVVEKIMITCKVEFKNNGFGAVCLIYNRYFDSGDIKCRTLIEATYVSVVQFIKWYNSKP